MTDEQERAIEALTLTCGGFAAETEARFVRAGNGEVFAVQPNGDVYEFERAYAITPFRRLMADTYGRGATP